MTVESVVRERYAQGAACRQESLCCPVSYDASMLEILPQEIIDRDYGCGNPSLYVKPGDTVVDLGSGGGKICYMAAQIVGEQGRVIGIDMTDEMLDLARRHQDAMAQRLGYANVEFHKGFIQDVAAIVAADTADIVISNCVLNLVAERDRRKMISGIFTVLRPGGRVAISDIVCEQAVPESMQQDPELWSGCISGAFQKEAFLQAFTDVGFEGARYDDWQTEAWQEVQGLKFYSATVCAVKPGGDDAQSNGVQSNCC